MSDQTLLTICTDLLQDLRQSSEPSVDADAEIESFTAAWLYNLEVVAEGRPYRVLTHYDRGYHEHTPTDDERALWQAAHDLCHRNEDGTWA